MDVQAATKGRRDMDPWAILWPPVFVLAEGGVLALLILACEHFANKKPATATVAFTVNYDLTATCDDLPDFDAMQNYCPACLARWHEFNPTELRGLVPAGDPSLCEQHTRRLAKSCKLDPRAIARGSVAWLLYAIRPQGDAE